MYSQILTETHHFSTFSGELLIIVKFRYRFRYVRIKFKPMNKLFTLLKLCFAFQFTNAQDCTPYFPMDEGTTFEITNYDKKDRVTSSATHEVLNKRELPGGGLVADVQMELFDQDGENMATSVYEIKCVDGVFYLDMQTMVNAEQMSSMDLDATVGGDYLEFMNNLEPGMELPDATLSVSLGSGGTAIMTMNINVTDRVVGEEESITTPAGTFECITLTQSVATKMIVNIKASSKSWFAENIGTVRSESYNKRGKLTGYSVLTSLTTN
jgi:hypothetical protein